MSAASKKLESDALPDSDEDFKYEEVPLGDEWGLTEGEEDLEATVKATQERAEASARAASSKHQQLTVVEFLCNFLLQADMRETLDCFQAEWTEMVHKGLVDADLVGVVPEVYTENMRLDSKLKNAQREKEEYRHAASAAAETLLRVQRARDVHRLQHRRVVQEKNKLIEDIRKLTVQCHSFEPALKRMNEKYQVALKQVMLVASERDKALGLMNPEEAAVNKRGASSISRTSQEAAEGAASGSSLNNQINK